MLGALGKREMDEGGTCALPAAEATTVRGQAARVLLLSAAIAVVATIAAWYL